MSCSNAFWHVEVRAFVARSKSYPLRLSMLCSVPGHFLVDHLFLPIIIHLDEWITPAENGIVAL
jgi:hypothetical protein